MAELLNTKQVAQYLGINEKKVYYPPAMRDYWRYRISPEDLAS
jgi:hypothetical protein